MYKSLIQYVKSFYKESYFLFFKNTFTFSLDDVILWFVNVGYRGGMIKFCLFVDCMISL